MGDATHIPLSGSDKKLRKNSNAKMRKLVIALVLLVVLSVFIESGISWGIAVFSAKNSTIQLLEQVTNSLITDAADESTQVEELKEDYVSYARTVAYILDADPSAVHDQEKLTDIANLLGIDEIHIFDALGTIYAGTVSGYYGYSFDSGEQMGYFKPMLTDKDLGMCQDITPNTAEGKSMMYAIAWNEQGTMMVQVGIEPKRLLAALKDHELSNVISKTPLSEGMSITVLDPETLEVTASTDGQSVGKNAANMFGDLKLSGAQDDGLVINSSGWHYCACQQVEDDEIVVSYSLRTSSPTVVGAAVVITIYMLIAAIIIFTLFRRVYLADEEKTRHTLELEKRQRQLEEATAKQEAQIEEINGLNIELEQAREGAEAASDAKTSFLFNMSHDIRTPMNAIIGFADLMEKHDDDKARRQEYLQKIKDSSTVLLNIINNVLDMARIEKGATVLEETAWSVEQFIDSITNVFTDMMDEKGIEFTKSVDVEHGYIYCDATKMTQVFNNILSNAYKYTNPGGSVEFLVKELPSDREGYALLETTISDTGIGMDVDFLPHLFEEFSREHTSTETKIQGTGLGMPIVKRLIDLMGGTIAVRSEKGVGSTFVVTMPHRIASQANLAQAGDFEYDPAIFVGKRILLAEDNDLNAEIAMEILTEAGFEVDRAEDGDVCVDMLARAPMDYYDVVLMDIQMPRMNGYEATREIRAMGDTAKANIPIMAMTANAFEEDKREAFCAGMNGHIAKPIDVPGLMQTLARVLL